MRLVELVLAWPHGPILPSNDKVVTETSFSAIPSLDQPVTRCFQVERWEIWNFADASDSIHIESAFIQIIGMCPIPIPLLRHANRPSTAPGPECSCTLGQTRFTSHAIGRPVVPAVDAPGRPCLA